MKTHQHDPQALGAPRRLIGPLVLAVLLWSCGGEEAPQASSTRTGSIFGGTPAPTSSRESAPEPSEPPAQAPSEPRAPSPGGSGLDITGVGHDFGSADAPIKVVEFSDFGCGYCRQFHMETYPRLYEEYVETGKVAWKYVPYVLGIFPNGVPSARAGECAIAQDGFAGFGQRLFEEQDAWKEENEPLDVFVRLARDEGLDAERFRTCYEERLQDHRVQRNMELGRRVGVRGTPTFLVQGQRVSGALPLEAFREIFDEILAGQAVTDESTEGGEG